ncbi:MAG: low molecular weight protein-tyrosine-phosphatase [Kineosporiaceae bacterium]
MSPDGRFRVCFVCSGNICRSPMAEVVLRALVQQRGLEDVVLVDSAGTGDWHIGERADRRALRSLTGGGYDGSAHRARQFDPQWFDERDLVIALDRGHARTLRAWASDEDARAKVHLLREFDPALASEPEAALLDVPDPYYDGDAAFDGVLSMVVASCQGLLDRIEADLDAQAAG